MDEKPKTSDVPNKGMHYQQAALTQRSRTSVSTATTSQPGQVIPSSKVDGVVTVRVTPLAYERAEPETT